MLGECGRVGYQLNICLKSCSDKESAWGLVQPCREEPNKRQHEEINNVFIVHRKKNPMCLEFRMFRFTTQILIVSESRNSRMLHVCEGGFTWCGVYESLTWEKNVANVSQCWWYLREAQHHVETDTLVLHNSSSHPFLPQPAGSWTSFFLIKRAFWWKQTQWCRCKDRKQNETHRKKNNISCEKRLELVGKWQKGKCRKQRRGRGGSVMRQQVHDKFLE